MPSLRVFLSSTCFDLVTLRSTLRNAILELGHEPILSEFNEVLYDPGYHTHASCVREVEHADVMVLVLGSRFGGEAIKEALNFIDFAKLTGASSMDEFLKGEKHFSITQLEVLTAISRGIPVYTFITQDVYYDYNLYQKNKDNKHVVDHIVYNSGTDRNTAPYIFNFISFLRGRLTNNQISEFRRTEDIIDILKMQWSSYFRQLLHDRRESQKEAKELITLETSLNEIKALILSNLSDTTAKAVGKGVLKYGLLFRFLYSFVDNPEELDFSKDWDQLMTSMGVYEISLVSRQDIRPFSLALTSKGYYISDGFLLFRKIENLMHDWERFGKLDATVRKGVSASLFENGVDRALYKKTTQDYIGAVLKKNFEGQDVQITKLYPLNSNPQYTFNFSDFIPTSNLKLGFDTEED